MTKRALLLTPALDGIDGISEVSRQAARALMSLVGPSGTDVWALRGGRPAGLDCALGFQAAAGSRARLARWALARSGARLDDLLVVAMHLHLAPLMLVMAMRGARTAVFLHGIESWRPLRRRELLALDAATLVANSNHTVERFREANPRFGDRQIPVCHLSIDRPGALAELPIDRGFALIVGRMSSEERYKGHDELIAAWPAVLAAVPDARLFIAGDGDDRERLETVVAANNLGRAIRFLGPVTAGALEGLYRAAAFFVMPSTGEGFGLAYLEAMHAGKACVAVPGAASEIVIDGTTGLLVQRGPDLVAALVTLFTNQALRERLGSAGAERAASQFGPGQFGERFVRALAPLAVPAAV